MRQKSGLILQVALLCCVIFVLSACSQDAAPPQAVATATSRPATPTAIPSPTPIPAVQTDCPQAGTARVAVMPPMSAVGKNANVVYIYNDSINRGINVVDTLRRYDTVTGQKTDILKVSGAEIAMGDARLSPDGQWVLFWTRADHNILLQMVRMDGKEQQTLYCVKDEFQNIIWSPDQKYVLFSQPGQVVHSYDLYTLDLATGTLQDILQPLPLPANSQIKANIDNPIKWISNKSLLVEHTTPNVEMVGRNYGFYLIKDITAATTQIAADLQQITVPGTSAESVWGFHCGDVDVSGDGTQLLYSACHYPTGTSNESDNASIFVQPLLGGTAHTIYSDKTHLIENTRFVSPTTVLFVMENADHTDPQVWKISTDGTGLTLLYDAKQGLDWAGFFIQSQSYQYIDTTADGTLFTYCFRVQNALTVTVIYGTLSGGNAVTVAQTSPDTAENFSSIKLVGWVSM